MVFCSEYGCAPALAASSLRASIAQFMVIIPRARDAVRPRMIGPCVSIMKNWQANSTLHCIFIVHDLFRNELHTASVIGKFRIRVSFIMYASLLMMTSSNGNISRVTDHLCGEFTGPGEFPTQRPVTRSFDVYFDLRPNKWLSKQSWVWWFETLSYSLWRHRNVNGRIQVLLAGV